MRKGYAKTGAGWFLSGRLSGLRAAARLCRKTEYVCGGSRGCGRIATANGIAQDIEAKARREAKAARERD